MSSNSTTHVGRALQTLEAAALDSRPVSGWTHSFYKYPARFSPVFASAAIKGFSKPGDVIVDPYMGGGTSVVEGVAAGRHAVGSDLNSLATFIARVKTQPLATTEIESLQRWKNRIPTFNYRRAAEDLTPFVDDSKVRNLGLPRARFLKKAMAAALHSLQHLPSEASRDFARCAILRVGQWALDGRKKHTSLEEFRARLAVAVDEMLDQIVRFAAHAEEVGGRSTLLNLDAARIDQSTLFSAEKARVDLVVTSPPYPGVHVLYHRWQVDGRRETPAPYWIANCSDGKGASYYNFADKRQGSADRYFENSLSTLKAVRRVMRDDAYIIQLIAFSRPEEHLERYLSNMGEAGFREVRVSGRDRISRSVPNRKWQATLRGRTSSSMEIALVHQAV